MSTPNPQGEQAPSSAPPDRLKPGDEAWAGTPGTGADLCEQCGGRGKISNGQECPNCEGTGKVIHGIGGG